MCDRHAISRVPSSISRLCSAPRSCRLPTSPYFCTASRPSEFGASMTRARISKTAEHGTSMPRNVGTSVAEFRMYGFDGVVHVQSVESPENKHGAGTVCKRSSVDPRRSETSAKDLWRYSVSSLLLPHFCPPLARHGAPAGSLQHVRRFLGS